MTIIPRPRINFKVGRNQFEFLLTFNVVIVGVNENTECVNSETDILVRNIDDQQQFTGRITVKEYCSDLARCVEERLQYIIQNSPEQILHYYKTEEDLEACSEVYILEFFRFDGPVFCYQVCATKNFEVMRQPLIFFFCCFIVEGFKFYSTGCVIAEKL